jgi:hypothetical protein
LELRLDFNQAAGNNPGGAGPTDPSLGSQQRGANVRRLSPDTLRRRFQTTCHVG